MLALAWLASFVFNGGPNCCSLESLVIEVLRQARLRLDLGSPSSKDLDSISCSLTQRLERIRCAAWRPHSLYLASSKRATCVQATKTYTGRNLESPSRLEPRASGSLGLISWFLGPLFEDWSGYVAFEWFLWAAGSYRAACLILHCSRPKRQSWRLCCCCCLHFDSRSKWRQTTSFRRSKSGCFIVFERLKLWWHNAVLFCFEQSLLSSNLSLISSSFD